MVVVGLRMPLYIYILREGELVWAFLEGRRRQGSMALAQS